MNTQSPPDATPLVLDGADLDLLELALGGAIDNAFTSDEPTRQLTDAENTPLAELAPAGMEGSHIATAIQPFHVGQTAQWEPALRSSAREVLQAVGVGDVLGIAITDFPTLADLGRINDAVAATSPRRILWAIFVGRASGSIDSGPEGPALVRTITQLAPESDSAVTVVIPWSVGARPMNLQLSRTDPTSPDFVRQILTGYGADDVFDVAAARPDDDRQRINKLGDARRNAALSVYPSVVVDELERLSSTAAAADSGLVVLLTGLSGSGKSTIAHALSSELPTRLGRQSTLLDGDEVRQMLSAGLGFDRESRELNVKRIGYVAGLIARHGGTAIAAPIAPFTGARAYVRAQAEANGRFLLVYVSTPLEVCEARDRKGLYAKARAGEIDDFTGISSPYEVPDDADLTIDTSETTVDDAVDMIVRTIESR